MSFLRTENDNSKLLNTFYQLTIKAANFSCSAHSSSIKLHCGTAQYLEFLGLYNLEGGAKLTFFQNFKTLSKMAVIWPIVIGFNDMLLL